MTKFRIEQIDKDFCEICDCICDEESLVVPEKIKGYTVASIGMSALSMLEPNGFDYFETKEITIPFSVKKLGKSIFGMNPKLETVNLPAQVMELATGDYSNYYQSYTLNYDSIKNCGKKKKLNINFMFEDGKVLRIPQVDTTTSEINHLLELILGNTIDNYEKKFDIIKSKEIRYAIILFMALVQNNETFTKLFKHSRKRILEHIIINSLSEYAKIIFDSSVLTSKQKAEFAEMIRASENSTLISTIPASATPVKPAAKKSSRPKKIKVGNKIQFGKYHILNEAGYQPIEWRVIAAAKGGKYMLLSEYSLECRPYNNEENYDWKSTKLREWLNNDFYNIAFNEEEKCQIESEYYFESGVSRGADVYEDRVTLLSESDYSDVRHQFPRMEKSKLTPYAIEKYKKNPKKAEPWWLTNQHVNKYGSCERRKNYREKLGVRPVIWIKTEVQAEQKANDKDTELDLSSLQKKLLLRCSDMPMAAPDGAEIIQYKISRTHTIMLSSNKNLYITFDETGFNNTEYKPKDLLIRSYELYNVKEFYIDSNLEDVFAFLENGKIKAIHLIKNHSAVSKWDKICADIEADSDIKQLLHFFSHSNEYRGSRYYLALHNDGTFSFYNGDDNKSNEFDEFLNKLNGKKIERIYSPQSLCVDFEGNMIMLSSHSSSLHSFMPYNKIDDSKYGTAIYTDNDDIIIDAPVCNKYTNAKKAAPLFKDTSKNYDECMILYCDGTIEMKGYCHEQVDPYVVILNELLDKVEDVIYYEDNNKKNILTLHKSGDVRLNAEMIAQGIKKIEYDNGKIYAYYQ